MKGETLLDEAWVILRGKTALSEALSCNGRTVFLRRT